MSRISCIIFCAAYHETFVECVSHGTEDFLVDISVRLTQILHKQQNRTTILKKYVYNDSNRLTA